jgi:hypothetical protein
MEEKDSSEAPLTPNDRSKRILECTDRSKYINLFVYLGRGILDYCTAWPGRFGFKPKHVVIHVFNKAR